MKPTKQEEAIIELLRKFDFGEISIFKQHGNIVRVRMQESLLITEQGLVGKEDEQD